MGQFAPTRAADNIRPPVSGEVTAYAVTSTSTRLTVPTLWRGRYVTLQADSANVYVLFGGASVVASDTATDGTSAAQQCVFIPSGGSIEVFLPASSDATVVAMAYKTASGTTTLRAWPSSPREGMAEPGQGI
mgnify:CR=1 FL=1|jgi:hypothetical protein